MCEDLLRRTIRLDFEIHPHYFDDVDNMKRCVICDVTSAYYLQVRIRYI
jgi:hypothetical protein